jgi:hypothetical protein
VQPVVGEFVEAIATVWAAGWGGKLLTITAGWSAVSLGGEAGVNYLNLLFNAVMFLVAVGLAFPIAKDRRKSQTIQTQNNLIDALTKDNEAKEQAHRNLEQGSHHLKAELAAAEARYEEALKYTSRDSVERFEGLLTAQTETLERIALTLDAIDKRLDGRSRPSEPSKK